MPRNVVPMKPRKAGYSPAVAAEAWMEVQAQRGHARTAGQRLDLSGDCRPSRAVGRAGEPGVLWPHVAAPVVKHLRDMAMALGNDPSLATPRQKALGIVLLLLGFLLAGMSDGPR